MFSNHIYNLNPFYLSYIGRIRSVQLSKRIDITKDHNTNSFKPRSLEWIIRFHIGSKAFLIQFLVWWVRFVLDDRFRLSILSFPHSFIQKLPFDAIKHTSKPVFLLSSIHFDASIQSKLRFYRNRRDFWIFKISFDFSLQITHHSVVIVKFHQLLRRRRVVILLFPMMPKNRANDVRFIGSFAQCFVLIEKCLDLFAVLAAV